MRQRHCLYVREQLECMELCLGLGEELTENLRVKLTRRAGTVDVILRVCYRPRDQEDQAHEALNRHTEAGSYAQALVLMEDLNHPDICQRDIGYQGIGNL